jgi:hypothetical protein
MGAPGSEQAGLEEATWPELSKLANEHPESGVAFESTIRLFFCCAIVCFLTSMFPEAYIHTRVEDVGKAGSLFAQSDNRMPWWSHPFHDVCQDAILVPKRQLHCYPNIVIV